MSEIEIAPDWEELPGTDAGSYYRLDGDLLLAVPRAGYDQSREDAERSLAALDRIAQTAGRKQAVVVLVDRVVAGAGVCGKHQHPRFQFGQVDRHLHAVPPSASGSICAIVGANRLV